jgi:hypothetical protein
LASSACCTHGTRSWSITRMCIAWFPRAALRWTSRAGCVRATTSSCQ